MRFVLYDDDVVLSRVMRKIGNCTLRMEILGGLGSIITTKNI